MPTADSMFERAKAELADLRAEDDQLSKTIQGLELKRESVRAEIAKLEGALEVLKRYGEAPKAPSGPKVATVRNPAMFKKLTTAQAAELLLMDEGGSLSAVDLIKRLEQVGKMRKGNKNNYGLLSQAIGKNKAFRKQSPGVWGLAPKED